MIKVDTALPLFVYGTLQRHFRNRWARKLWRGATDLGPARVAGRLYSLGWCPAMLPPTGPNQWVRGRLVLPANSAILAELDGYEGASYQRRRVLAGGRDAWAYFHATELPARRRIRSGAFQPRPARPY